MMKTLGMITGLIILGICVQNLSCKDKAEAKISELNELITTTSDITTMDANDIILWDSEIYLEVTLTDEPNFAETDRIYLHKGDDFDIVIEKKEPNESLEHFNWGIAEDWIRSERNNPEPNEPKKYSLPIPTWPDYIELEKDLILDCIDGPHDPNDYYTITKGTKIYFKENE